MRKNLISKTIIMVTIVSMFCTCISYASTPIKIDDNIFMQLEYNDLNQGTMYISGKGNMPNYGKETPPSSDNTLGRGKLIKVEVGEGITSIGRYNFYTYMDLKDVILPSTITTIKEGAFWGSDQIRTVNLPEGIVTIEEKAFFKHKIRNLVLPKSLETLGVGAFQGFEDTSAQTKITFPENGKLKELPKNAFSGLKIETVDGYFAVPAYIETIGDYVFSAGKSYGITKLDILSKSDNISLSNYLLTIGANKNEKTTIVVHTQKAKEQLSEYVYQCDKVLLHEPKDAGKNIAATCSVDGYTEYVCKTCGETYKDNIVKATGHTKGDFVLSKDATCTEDGYTEYKCKTCGENFKTDIVSKIEHNLGEYIVEKDATYNEAGSKYKECSTCHEKFDIQEIPMLVDDISPKVTIAIEKNEWKEIISNITFGLFFKENKTATLTAKDDESGIANVYYYVSNKELSNDEILTLKDSDWIEGNSVDFNNDNEYVVYAKVVDKQGNTSYASSNGIVIDKTKPIITLKGESNKEQSIFCGVATVKIEEKNIETITVNNKAITLDENNEYVINTPGDYINILIYVKDKAGNEGAIKFKVNAAHTSDIDKSTCTTDKVCTVCGKILEKADGITHVWGEYVSDNNVTCTKDGTKTRECLECKEKETITDTNTALGHNITDWNITKAATCTDAGSKKRHCTRCNECNEIEQIPALGHNFDTKWTVDVEAEGTNAGTKSHHCLNENCTEKADVTEFYLPANYSKVDEAISKIPTNLERYTDETIKALENAKAAVVKNKDIREQESVNKYADDIENAINNLKVKTYDITIVTTKGGNISTASPITVEYGANQELIITADKGYKIKVVKINGIDKLSILVDGKLMLTNIKESVKVEAEFVAEEYEFIEGQNSTYTKNDETKSDMKFKLNGLYSLFNKLYVNGTELSTDNYTVTEGSTIITLKNDYLSILDVGTYTLKATYTNGSSDETAFVIEEKKDTENTTNTNETANTQEDTSPKTSDNILYYIGIFVVAVLGSIVVLFEKNKMNKENKQ